MTMYVLYLDASGDAGQYVGTNSKFYVLAGMAVKPERWHQTRQEVAKTVQTHFGSNPPPRELHASVMVRSKPPFHKINVTKLIDDIYTLISKIDFTLFAVVIDKVAHWRQYVRPFPPQELALDSMVGRYEWFLERTNDVGMIVNDQAGGGYDKRLLNLFEGFKRDGATYKKLDRMIDTVFFTPSETAVFLQLVDLWAYAIYVNSEFATSGDPRYVYLRSKYALISAKFDRDLNGNVVGLRQFP